MDGPPNGHKTWTKGKDMAEKAWCVLEIEGSTYFISLPPGYIFRTFGPSRRGRFFLVVVSFLPSLRSVPSQ